MAAWELHLSFSNDLDSFKFQDCKCKCTIFGDLVICSPQLSTISTAYCKFNILYARSLLISFNMTLLFRM